MSNDSLNYDTCLIHMPKSVLSIGPIKGNKLKQEDWLSNCVKIDILSCPIV